MSLILSDDLGQPSWPFLDQFSWPLTPALNSPTACKNCFMPEIIIIAKVFLKKM
jgi:hypothetical protein